MLANAQPQCKHLRIRQKRDPAAAETAGHVQRARPGVTREQAFASADTMLMPEQVPGVECASAWRRVRSGRSLTTPEAPVCPAYTQGNVKVVVLQNEAFFDVFGMDA